MRWMTALFFISALLLHEPLHADNTLLVFRARTRALAILVKAADKARKEDELIFNRVRSALEGATIKIPRPGQDFDFCSEKGGILAFNIPRIKDIIEDTIFLCAASLHDLSNEKFTAQTLIHESAHLVGNVGKDADSECDAAWVEVAAMRFSMEGLEYKSSYMKDCGYW